MNVKLHFGLQVSSLFPSSSSRQICQLTKRQTSQTAAHHKKITERKTKIYSTQRALKRPTGDPNVPSFHIKYNDNRFQHSDEGPSKRFLMTANL
jgi:hypothetical protein